MQNSIQVIPTGSAITLESNSACDIYVRTFDSQHPFLSHIADNSSQHHSTYSMLIGKSVTVGIEPTTFDTDVRRACWRLSHRVPYTVEPHSWFIINSK